jgi:hypothetical protein
LLTLPTYQLPDTPEFIQHRLDVFDRIKARRDEEIAGACAVVTPLWTSKDL